MELLQKLVFFKLTDQGLNQRPARRDTKNKMQPRSDSAKDTKPEKGVLIIKTWSKYLLDLEFNLEFKMKWVKLHAQGWTEEEAFHSRLIFLLHQDSFIGWC